VNQEPDHGQSCIVAARDVIKTYRLGDSRYRALRGVTLTVAASEMVAVMGPSGCGKTTLLNCLSGLDRIDSGSVRIAGRDLAPLDDDSRTAFRARHMGFAFQTYNLLPVLSAIENVELPLLLTGVAWRQARRRAAGALDQVGMGDRAHHRPAELSGGQRQRVAVARALATRPSIVWCDEPTGALDSAASRQVMDLMLDLNSRHGLTFVWVTHAPEVARLAHRLVTMRDGAIEDDLPVREAVSRGLLADAFRPPAGAAR
jgi:putative ABC transport system ATP-binding protein